MAQRLSRCQVQDDAAGGIQGVEHLNANKAGCRGASTRGIDICCVQPPTSAPHLNMLHAGRAKGRRGQHHHTEQPALGTHHIHDVPAQRACCFLAHIRKQNDTRDGCRYALQDQGFGQYRNGRP